MAVGAPETFQWEPTLMRTLQKVPFKKLNEDPWGPLSQADANVHRRA